MKRMIGAVALLATMVLAAYSLDTAQAAKPAAQGSCSVAACEPCPGPCPRPCPPCPSCPGDCKVAAQPQTDASN